MLLCPKYLLHSTNILLHIYRHMFSTFRVIMGEYIVKISRGVVEVVYGVNRLDLCTFDIKSLSWQYRNKSVIIGAQLVPVGIPTICWYTMPTSCKYIFSMRKVKALHTLMPVKQVDESYFLIWSTEAVFDSLLKHNLTRDNTVTLIRSCGKNVYKVEKS